MQIGDTEPNSKYYLEKYFNLAYITHHHFICIILFQLHTEYLVLESFLDPIPNLPKFLNPNNVLNTLISPGYLLINTHPQSIDIEYDNNMYFPLLSGDDGWQ